MTDSTAFARVRERAALDVDGEQLYIVRGDTLGDEEDLLLEAAIRGAQSRDPSDPNRAVYLDLDEETREVIDQRVRG